MDEMNVIYFAPKCWLYVMIWLPGTTDNSTYFAQSLEIQGIESRLYYYLVIFIFSNDTPISHSHSHDTTISHIHSHDTTISHIHFHDTTLIILQ